MFRRLVAALLGGAALAVAPCVPASALTINASFYGSWTPAEQAVVNNSINFYQTTFSDPIIATIGFWNMTTGLGQSSTYGLNVTYSQYRTALTADQTTTNDATALASLPTGSANPANGGRACG